MEKIVRCSSSSATPYLRENIGKLGLAQGSNIIDLGCGNGRSSEYLKGLGFSVFAFDRKPDYGLKLDLSCEKIPKLPTPDLIICNYVLCFMKPKERRHLANEINKIAKPGCILIVELYNAKSAYPYTTEKIEKMFTQAGWKTRHLVRDRFILQRE